MNSQVLQDSQPEGRFKVDSLQALNCAKLINDDHKYVIGVVRPGSGKSFMNLLIADHFS